MRHPRAWSVLLLTCLVQAPLHASPRPTQPPQPPARDDAPTCAAVSASARRPAASARAQWSVWGANLSNTRAVAPAARATSDSLVLRWALRLGEVANARAQAAVANDRVFVVSEAGSVWALDAERGCQWWRASLGVPLRTSPVLATDARGEALTVYLGDATGQVQALDAATGAVRWRVKVDAHPTAIVTGAPQLYAGVLYVGVSSYESAMALQPKYACCTFRGSVVALDARTGAQRWKRHTIDETPAPSGTSPSGVEVRGPSGAAVWSTPTIDVRRGRLYVGTGNNYSDPQSARSDAVIALDLRTGDVVWSRQFTARDGYNVSCDMPGKYNCPKADGPDADVGQPPMLVALRDGTRVLLVGAKSGWMRALDPDRDGALRWEYQVGPSGKLGGLHWGSASDGTRVYAAYGGQITATVPDSTAPGGMRLQADARAGGGLIALDVRTGAVRWRAPAPVCTNHPGCSPAQSAAVTVAHGIVWSGALDGHLRGYDPITGRVVWDEDTTREYPVRNGGVARGGSLDVGGPVVAGNSLYVGSGYGMYGAIPGNVFLAFTRVATAPAARR